MSHYVANYLLVNREGGLSQNDSPLAQITGRLRAVADLGQCGVMEISGITKFFVEWRWIMVASSARTALYQKYDGHRCGNTDARQN
jgi:hypothetical protein